MNTKQEIEELKKIGPFDHLKKRREPVKYESSKIQRNDPCPCGSGKKYKNYHLPLVTLKRDSKNL